MLSNIIKHMHCTMKHEEETRHNDENKKLISKALVLKILVATSKSILKKNQSEMTRKK